MNTKDIRNILIEEINSGLYADNMKLPTEDELVERFKTTRYKIRQAIDLLVDLSIVYQVQGSGNYIRESTKKGSLTLSSTKGISQEFPDKDVKTKLLKMNHIKANQEQANLLQCDLNEALIEFTRIRYVDQEPFAIEYSLYIKSYVPLLNKEIIEQSIFQYIEQETDTSVGFADKMINTRLITKDEASLLNLKENDPAIVIDDTVYSKTGSIISYTSVVYNYTLASFFEPAVFKKSNF